MKFNFLSTGEFLFVYFLFILLDFVIPGFLPNKVWGPYLFWSSITILTIFYSFVKLNGRQK